MCVCMNACAPLYLHNGTCYPPVPGTTRFFSLPPTSQMTFWGRDSVLSHTQTLHDAGEKPALALTDNAREISKAGRSGEIKGCYIRTSCHGNQYQKGMIRLTTLWCALGGTGGAPAFSSRRLSCYTTKRKFQSYKPERWLHMGVWGDSPPSRTHTLLVAA